MCIGDDPLARAIPFIISGIVSLIIMILLFIQPFVKKLNSKYINISKIIMIIITLLLAYITYSQLTTRMECI